MPFSHSALTSSQGDICTLHDPCPYSSAWVVGAWPSYLSLGPLPKDSQTGQLPLHLLYPITPWSCVVVHSWICTIR